MPPPASPFSIFPGAGQVPGGKVVPAAPVVPGSGIPADGKAADGKAAPAAPVVPESGTPGMGRGAWGMGHVHGLVHVLGPWQPVPGRSTLAPLYCRL